MRKQSGGETFIVTGGNRGIGFDVSRKLIHAGHDVILCSRDLLAGKDACERICSTQPPPRGSCQASKLDVADPSAVQSFIAEVTQTQSGKIFGLVNNAAVYTSGWTQAIFDTAMATNFRGPVDLAIGLAPHMKEGGRIINVGSTFSQLTNLQGPYRNLVKGAVTLKDLCQIQFKPESNPAPFNPTYCLSKAMLNRATQIMAKSPEFSHLSINAADPGWVRTDAGGPDAPRSVDQGSSSIMTALNLPRHMTGSFFLDGKPQKF